MLHLVTLLELRFEVASKRVSYCADDPTNHKILMVLEYVEGGSLFSGTRISPKKRLSELQARKYFRDVLQVWLTLQQELIGTKSPSARERTANQ